MFSPLYSLAMSAGNMAKRRQLEVPSAVANITSSRKKTNISSVYAVKPNTKRNLMSQLNEQSQVFVLPQSKRVISHAKPPLNKVRDTSKTFSSMVSRFSFLWLVVTSCICRSKLKTSFYFIFAVIGKCCCQKGNEKVSSI